MEAGQQNAETLIRLLEPLSISERVLEIDRFARLHSLPIVFGTSFGAEDQLLTSYLSAQKIRLTYFSLDTGRLFPETYDIWRETEERYGIQIQCFFPDPADVEKFVQTEGINGFYNSVSNRKQCCGIRKVAPLERALSGAGIWLTGLRREQDPERSDINAAEYDERFNVIKVNPLVDLGTEEMWARIRSAAVPYHKLHDKGFPSIGCAPCTRAIKPGEPLRAGRWWWEEGLPKECGLHHLFDQANLEPPEKK